MASHGDYDAGTEAVLCGDIFPQRTILREAGTFGYSERGAGIMEGTAGRIVQRCRRDNGDDQQEEDVGKTYIVV